MENHIQRADSRGPAACRGITRIHRAGPGHENVLGLSSVHTTLVYGE